jgi:hypothetical protein
MISRIGCITISAVVVVVLLLLPGGVLAQSPTGSGSSVPLGSTAVVESSTCTGGCVAVNFTTENENGVPAPWTNSSGYDLSSNFWGTTVSPRSHIIPDEGQILTATPNRVIVWPGANAGEYYNPLNGTIYTDVRHLVSGHSKVFEHEWYPASTNESQFVAFCRSINCTAIFQVPAEDGDAALASEIVNYTIDSGVHSYTEPDGQVVRLAALNFTPAYWEIGNEPQLWRLTGDPMQTWPIGTNTTATKDETPLGYADLVEQFIRYMRSGDPKINVIGLPAAGRPDPYPVEDWIAAVEAVDGPNIVGIAYHDYPAGNAAAKKETDATVQNFYASINSQNGIPARVEEIHGGILNGSIDYSSWLHTAEELFPGEDFPTESACLATCEKSQIVFITEFGTALDHQDYGHFSAVFPGALDYAGQVVQAIDNASPSLQNPVVNLDVFGTVFNTSNSWVNLTGWVRPSYTMFSEILDHLGNEAFRVQLTDPDAYDPLANQTPLGSTLLANNLYAVATVDTTDHDRADLLVANLNVTKNISFIPQLPPTVSRNAPTEVWTWQGVVSNPYDNWANATVDPATPNPVAEFFPDGIPSSFTLPYQSVALFEAYPQGGVPVEIQATYDGVPLIEVHDAGHNYSGARWFVQVNGHLTIGNNTSNVTIFVPDGTASDPNTYSFVSYPIALNSSGTVLRPGNNPTYVRERLNPYPPGSISVGPESDATPQLVTIPFALQYETNVTTRTLDGPPTGKAGGTVSPDPTWWNASAPLTMTARPAYHYAFVYWEGFGTGSVNSTVARIKLTPTAYISEKAEFAWAYPVTFSETGLPAGTQWGVAIHSHFDLAGVPSEVNRSYSSLTGSLAVEAPNGTYGFTIDNVAGYRASVGNSSFLLNSSFTLQGASIAVDLQFSPTSPAAPRYAVTFVEAGLEPGTQWSLTTRNVTTTLVGNVTNVTVSNLTVSSTQSSMVVYEANGSYGYTASSVQGVLAHPSSYGYVVSGPGLVVPVDFANVTYNVVWDESGLGPGIAWWVRVTNASGTVTIPCSGAWTVARLVNGSYSFSIPSVDDHVPQLSSGSFTVRGSDLEFAVPFPEPSFAVTFSVSSMPLGDPWEVRFSNQTVQVDVLSTAFSAPNGSYTFDVTPAAGYIAVPSHGTVLIDGAPITIDVQVTLAGNPPVPPLLVLVTPALAATGAIALVCVGTLLVGRRRKRRQAGGSP